MNLKNIGLFSISLSFILGTGTLNLNSKVNAETREDRIIQAEIQKYIDARKEKIREIREAIIREEFQGYLAQPILNGVIGAGISAGIGEQLDALRGGFTGALGGCLNSCNAVPKFDFPTSFPKVDFPNQF